ncbi:MAG: TolB family protein [Geodermatophilaceae bacterium]
MAFAALQGEDRTDIFGLDAAGRAVQLTEGGLSDNPTFSPGGTEILFTRESEKRVAGEDPHRSLWLMDSDGYNERPLIADCYDELEMARYSPDGKTIALVGIIDPPQSEHRSLHDECRRYVDSSTLRR